MFLNDSSEFGIHVTEVDTCAICYKVITIYITFSLALKKKKKETGTTLITLNASGHINLMCIKETPPNTPVYHSEECGIGFCKVCDEPVT